MSTLTLEVNIPNHHYPIYIGSHLLSDSSVFTQHIKSQQVIIVTNDTVAKLYLPTLKKTLTDYKVDVITLSDGEQYKTLATWETILNKLVEHKHHRDSTLITLGGGVVGDMGGFAAACYQRGINFIQVPTTLLAQVDSSIGGKTAVNHLGGKNLVGAFYQPNTVIIDTDTLKTLPQREFNAGLAEIIKAALITDNKFFEWLCNNCQTLTINSMPTLTQAIYNACKIKADIVTADEKENNLRALLNLGHTFAHAIEHTLGYGVWLHGEAVAAGLVLAAKLSLVEGLLTQAEVTQITQLLENLHLPTKLPPELTVDSLLNSMQLDKKIKQGTLRFILLKSIGHAVICDNISEEKLKAVLYSNL